MLKALCAGSAPNLRKNPKAEDYFFPEKGQAQAYHKAVWMCMNCEVRPECDAYRDRVDAKHGMWAGKVANNQEEEGEEDYNIAVSG